MKYHKKVLVHSKAEDVFVRHLEKATEIVSTWPKWKQGLLGAATPELRKDFHKNTRHK